MYKNLALMTVLSFIVMYVLMSAMVDKYDNIYNNLNQVYMTAMMVSAMTLIEMAVMWSMYTQPHLNYGIILSCLVVFVGSLWGIRKQLQIGNKEFLKSMIPHHASALLMCKGEFDDPEIKQFCQKITSGQQEEINWMKKKLTAL